ncbi:MAG: hypothetical protein FWF77_05305 [Defluviitaleaceae bacterium]|nr:hypothetical protein [Defluviitaleaceae bacterium]
MSIFWIISISGRKGKKARQARIGHRGHVSESAHSLEAGSNFPAHKKARQARIGHRGHVSESAHSLEAGSSLLVSHPAKKESASVTRRLFFFKFTQFFKPPKNSLNFY